MPKVRQVTRVQRASEEDRDHAVRMESSDKRYTIAMPFTRPLYLKVAIFVGADVRHFCGLAPNAKFCTH